MRKRGNKLGLALIMAVALSACSAQREPPLETIPAMVWQEIPVTPFLTANKWQTADHRWDLIDRALAAGVTIPEALETRLNRSDREIWEQALTFIEQSASERADALYLAKAEIAPAADCPAPRSAFSLKQHAQIQLTLQMHRNVMWRMGRLEMASRGVFNAMQAILPMFSGGRIKDADINVAELMRKMMKQIEALRADRPVPRDAWTPGAFQVRMARTAHAAPIFLQAKTILVDWNDRMKLSSRWQYLANSPDSLITALDAWMAEYQALLGAYSAYAVNIRRMERDFAPPNALVAYPCINKNFRTLRILSELLSHLLPMQWNMTRARDAALQVRAKLHNDEYDPQTKSFIVSEIDRFTANIDDSQALLARAEDLAFVTWDEANAAVWGGLPEYIDPIHNQPKPAVENPESWRTLYSEFQTQLAETRRLIAPEPPQPLNKYKKPYRAYIAEIVEELHAPSHIDEAEQSLLAISELEAHMVAIRDELLRLCKQGACRSFPEAELANSPRKSAWIVSWRQSPAQERTLGHTLVVINLCLLHLSRLVQRLSEIYAWFAETTNVDLSWKKLKSWQRIWTLYAEPNGTYAGFLRNVAALSESIDNMAQVPKKRAESDNLRHILTIQSQLFDLTLDYARFVDARSAVPVSFDALTETWNDLDRQLTEIEKLTAERDLTLYPDLQNGSKDAKRRPADIPR